MNKPNKISRDLHILEVLAVVLILLLAFLILNLVRIERLRGDESLYVPNAPLFNLKDRLSKQEVSLSEEEVYANLTNLKAMVDSYSLSSENSSSYFALYSAPSNDVRVNFYNENKAYSLTGYFGGQENEFRVLNNNVYFFRGNNLREASNNNSETAMNVIRLVDLSNYEKVFDDLKIGTIQKADEELDELDMVDEDLYYYVDKFIYNKQTNQYNLKTILGSQSCLETYAAQGQDSPNGCDDLLVDEWVYSNVNGISPMMHSLNPIKSDGYAIQYLN